MSRTLLALALAATAMVPVAPVQAVEVTPGCDNPVDVLCNQAWSPENPSTPVICVLYVQGHCRIG